MPFDLVLMNMSRKADWDRGVVNRNYYVARELSGMPEIKKVLHIDFLPHTFRRAARVLFEDIVRGGKKNVVKRGVLWVLRTGQKPNQYVLTTVEPIVSEKRFLRTLLSVLNHLEFQQTILWSYVPTFVGAFLLDSWEKKIFDVVDDWSAHPSYRSLWKRLEKNYQIIQAQADHIFTVSSHLTKKFAGHPSVHWVPNGVDPERFSAVHGTSPYPIEQTPRLVYVGVIQSRIDTDLLAHIATMRPNYHIYLLGPVWPDAHTDSLRTCPNIHFVGFVPAQRLPTYLVHANVGIMPHRNTPLVASMNPMKIYEYLAAGIPSVSTPIRDFGAFPGVTMTETHEQFLAAVDAAIAAPPSKEALRASIKSHTWASRVAALWSVIHGPKEA